MDKFNLYIPNNTWIHLLNPLIKYLCYVLIVIMSPALNYQATVIILILMQFLVISAKVPLSFFYSNLKFILGILSFMILVTFIYQNLTILFAFKFTIRFWIIFGYMFILNHTTQLIELVKILDKINRKIFNPEHAKSATLITLLIINFTPVLLKEIVKINSSLKSRGIIVTKGTIKERYNKLKIFITALIQKIDVLIDEYDLVMYGRNLSVHNLSNITKTRPIKLQDIATLVVVIGIIVLGVV